MQKKIIALAVAAMASGAAFAQSNVTVYGVVDMGQAWVKSSGGSAANSDQKTVGRLDNNSSYLGFKGTEDLGNGLKAVFQFEVGYNADDAAGSTSTGFGGGRDSYIGLAGGFGTVLAGNLTHPLRTFGAKVDVMPGAAGFGTTASITGTLKGTKTGADDRAKNAIAYVSPSFGGVNVIAAYVNGEARETDAQVAAGESYNQKQYQIAAQYAGGPLFVGAGYHKAVDFGATNAAGGGTDATVWRVAATYDLPTNTKLTALYDNTKLDAPAGDTKRAAWSVGAIQSFGKNAIGLQYARSGDVEVPGADANDAAKMWALGYTYSFSKRTTLHARYSKLSNDKDGTSAFYNNPVKNPQDGSAGSDFTGYMVGIRHSF